MPAQHLRSPAYGRHRAAPTVSRVAPSVRLAVAVLTALATIGAMLTAVAGATSTAGSTSTPIRAAFYYPWYPETEHWATHYTPSLGHYDSSDPAVLAAHVAAARYAGLDALIASWWGPGTPTDKRLPLLLVAAHNGGVSVAPYFEPEGQSPAPTTSQLNSDLDYLYARANASPAWLRVGGKPVLFVYNANATSCSETSRWMNANAGRFYINLKVFSGYQSCAVQPDSWHQYGPADRLRPTGQLLSVGFPGVLEVQRVDATARPRSRTIQDRPAPAGHLRRPVATGHHVQRVGRGNRRRVGRPMGHPERARRLPGRDARGVRRAHPRTYRDVVVHVPAGTGDRRPDRGRQRRLVAADSQHRYLVHGGHRCLPLAVRVLPVRGHRARGSDGDQRPVLVLLDLVERRWCAASTRRATAGPSPDSPGRTNRRCRPCSARPARLPPTATHRAST